MPCSRWRRRHRFEGWCPRDIASPRSYRRSCNTKPRRGRRCTHHSRRATTTIRRSRSAHPANKPRPSRGSRRYFRRCCTRDPACTYTRPIRPARYRSDAAGTRPASPTARCSHRSAKRRRNIALRLPSSWSSFRPRLSGCPLRLRPTRPLYPRRPRLPGRPLRLRTRRQPPHRPCPRRPHQRDLHCRRHQGHRYQLPCHPARRRRYVHRRSSNQRWPICAGRSPPQVPRPAPASPPRESRFDLSWLLSWDGQNDKRQLNRERPNPAAHAMAEPVGSALLPVRNSAADPPASAPATT